MQGGSPRRILRWTEPPQAHYVGKDPGVEAEASERSQGPKVAPFISRPLVSRRAVRQNRETSREWKDRAREVTVYTRRSMLALGLILVGLVLSSACLGSLEVLCTSVLRASLIVEVREAADGAPAARGTTGLSEHESGRAVELAAADDLFLHGDWPAELPGTHSVVLRSPGYRVEIVQAFVERDECHVETATVHAELTPEPSAVSVNAIEFIDGPKVDAYPASAGVRVVGDTLEISGFAPTNCTELHAVAFRVGQELHVQIEPSDVALTECVSPRLFSAKYILPPERTYLLVTNGYSFPTTLFSGQVRPTPPRLGHSCLSVNGPAAE